MTRKLVFPQTVRTPVLRADDRRHLPCWAPATATGIVLSTRRQNGILKRVRATPLPAWTYFLGLLAHCNMISAVDMALHEPSSPSAAPAGTLDPNDQCSIRR